MSRAGKSLKMFVSVWFDIKPDCGKRPAGICEMPDEKQVLRNVEIGEGVYFLSQRPNLLEDLADGLILKNIRLLPFR